MTTVYAVNKKNPTDIHVINDFVKSDQTSLSIDNVLFYRHEDALEFVESWMILFSMILT